MINYVAEKADEVERVAKKIKKHVEIYESNKKKFVLQECETMITDIEGKLKAMKREIKSEMKGV